MSRLRGSGSGERRTWDKLYDLSPGALWTWSTRQSLAFWLLCFYFFLEYVRPQVIWPSLDIIPWAQTTLMVCTVFLVLDPDERLRLRSPVSGLLVAFTLILVVSSFTAYNPGLALENWTIYFGWLLVFVLVISLINTRARFFVFMGFFLLWSFKMSQHAVRSWAGAGFAFRDWGVVGASGWFHDSGEFGIQMVIFFCLSSYFLWSFWDRWGTIKRLIFAAMPITAAIGVVGSSSRGALLGLGAAVVVMLAQSRRLKTAVAGVVLGVLVLVLIPEEQVERFETIGEDRTSRSRITLLEHGLEITNRHPAFGVGYKNWRVHYRSQYGRGLVPHNILVEAGAELGYLGLGAFLLLVGGTFRLNWTTRRICRSILPEEGFVGNMAYALDAALVGFLVCGQFVTVLFYPFFWINLAMAAAVHSIARAEAAQQQLLNSPPSVVRISRPVPANSPSVTGV